MPPILLPWLKTSETDAGGMAVEVELYHQYSIKFCFCVTDGIWYGSAYEAKVCHWIHPFRKNATHWHSSTLAEILWKPNSRCKHNEVVQGAQFWTAMLSCHTTKWRTSPSAHLCMWICRSWLQTMLFMCTYWLQCIGNDGGNVGISQSLHQVGLMNAHRGRERSPYASLSRPTELIQGWRWQFPGSHHYWWREVLSLLWASAKLAVHGVATLNSPSKKEFKMQPSADKVMCTIFWDRKGVILLNFLELTQIVNSDHYTMMLTKLNAQTSRIRLEKKITFLLQRDNTRPSLKIVEYTASPGWTVLPHPLYSPDLVPCDFHILRLMTKMDCMGNIFLAMI